LSEHLAALKARNLTDVKIGDTLVTVGPPRLRDCILAGDIPLDLLARLTTTADNAGEVMSLADAKHMAAFNDEVVCRTVRAIDGEPVRLTPDELGDIFTEEQLAELLAYGTRQKDPATGEA
jgi:hypothetical protein